MTPFPPLPTPHYPQCTHSNTHDAFTANQVHTYVAPVLAELDAMRDRVKFLEKELKSAVYVRELTLGYAVGLKERIDQYEKREPDYRKTMHTDSTSSWKTWGGLHEKTTSMENHHD